MKAIKTIATACMLIVATAVYAGNKENKNMNPQKKKRYGSITSDQSRISEKSI